MGDNIYLKRLNSKEQGSGRVEYGGEGRLRIEQDYDIEKNLKMANRQHASFICLNKLERIFYYVKKISTSWEWPQNY